MIKVAVCGANGKMGKVVCQAVENCEETELCARIDLIGDDTYRTIEDAKNATKIDVLIDFTQPKSIFENARYCLNNGIKMVIGTTGLSDEQIEELKQLSKSTNTGCLIAPNFSTGAVLLMKFAQMAAKYFDNVLTLRHDAPDRKCYMNGILLAVFHVYKENDFVYGLENIMD